MLALFPLLILGRFAFTLASITLSEQTQTPLYSESKSQGLYSAPFIFNSLSGLLLQWHNTIHGAGHSIVPGIVQPFTLLYHARSDSELPPPSPEFVAFDVEMSYAIMVSRRGGHTHLATYRTTRPAKILYLDGMSAAWGPGWLDSQHMFIYGMSNNSRKDTPIWDDFDRADKLCKWGQVHEVEGFVRMDAGFEIIWCDFASPTLQLVSHLNITPPGTPEMPWRRPDFPGRDLLPLDMELPTSSENTISDDPPERPRRHRPGGGEPPNQEPGRGPPRRLPRSDLALTGELEWVRAASRRAFSPQPHLTLFYSDMVTYYHPRLTSLARDRIGRPMHSHGLVNISAQDAQSVVEEVADVVARRAAGIGLGSGMDWGIVAGGIVEYWGDRISHMRALLVNASEPGANTTAFLLPIRTLAYTLLNPHMPTGLTPDASGWDLFFGTPPSMMAPNEFSTPNNISAFERCTTQATGFLSETQMTPQERLLGLSVESVLNRLCNDFGFIFAQSSDQVAIKSTYSRTFILQWTRRVEELMQWLDWPVWLRCGEVCPLDVSLVLLILCGLGSNDFSMFALLQCGLLLGTVPWNRMISQNSFRDVYKSPYKLMVIKHL
ncbi:hypothetical protein R3P38DRAFT_2954937 [Favolaschia claudopus]|uniref:Uncharacterized protein n=1 Tax=Favolaschia claudopus TaxID=2862362 RepID=A0AAW0BE85_9AGAR